MSTTNTQPSQEEINAMLASTAIGDLADAPEFVVLPDGVTRCTINFNVKKISEKLAFVVLLKTIEVLELANPNDVPPEAGTEVNIIYDAETEFGQGNFKKLLASIAAQHGVDTEAEEFKKTPLLDIITPFQGIEGNVVHKKVGSKKDKDRFYTNIVDITFGSYSAATTDSLIDQSAPAAEAQTTTGMTLKLGS